MLAGFIAYQGFVVRASSWGCLNGWIGGIRRGVQLDNLNESTKKEVEVDVGFKRERMSRQSGD